MNEQRQLQLIELDILKYVAGFCKRNDIPYSLYGGTLIGAIRHKGFIPWDDDIDICMLRKDYDRFISLWMQEKHDGYIIQNKETDLDFTQGFTKIRKDNTSFIQKEDIGKKYHKGIFIDIFPFDRIPNGLNHYFFKIMTMIYLLCCREFAPAKEKGAFMQRVISVLFLSLTNQKIRIHLRKIALKWITRFNDDSALPLVSIETLSALSCIYPHDIADEFTEVLYEGVFFQAWKETDLVLSIKYNDYMKLPPVSEQKWKHPPICLDFHNNTV